MDGYPSPFKANEGGPLRSVIGLDSPYRARPDQMHVFAYGYGKDFAASSVVLCSRMKVWPGSSMQARLDAGYASFRSWLKLHRHTTSLSFFSLKVFKMGQTFCLVEVVLQKVMELQAQLNLEFWGYPKCSLLA